MPFIMKALSLALLDFPIINSHYHKEKEFEFIQISNHNISFAIDTPHGLVVPNVKNCQNLNIVQIHEELNRIKISAESGKFNSQDLSDGTICISNIGN